MNETLCGIGSPVMPVWSKSKISQWNDFCSRRIHKGQDPNLQHRYMVRNMHCPMFLLFSLRFNPFFFFLSSARVVKGERRGWLEQCVLQFDLAFCFLTTTKDHTAEFLQLQQYRGSHSHSALAHTTKVCRRLLRSN